MFGWNPPIKSYAVVGMMCLPSVLAYQQTNIVYDRVAGTLSHNILSAYQQRRKKNKVMAIYKTNIRIILIIPF